METVKYNGTRSGKLDATMKRYGCGRATVEKIAKESDARVKIGKAVFYLWDRMDSYMSKLADEQK